MYAVIKETKFHDERIRDLNEKSMLNIFCNTANTVHIVHTLSST